MMYSNRHGELKQLPATYEDSSKDGESMIVNINKTSHFTVVNVPCDLPMWVKGSTARYKPVLKYRIVVLVLVQLIFAT